MCDLITFQLSFILSLKSIEKAIVNSDLGMTPNNDGEVIRLSVPQLTSDRRKVLLSGGLVFQWACFQELDVNGLIKPVLLIQDHLLF